MNGRCWPRRAGIVLVAAVLLHAVHARAERSLDGEWWIVLAARLGEEPSVFEPVNKAGELAHRCGVQTMGDFSAKFSGLRPGYYVVVAGGFHDHGEALRVLAQVRPCVADAYVRQARYAGE